VIGIICSFIIGMALVAIFYIGWLLIRDAIEDARNDDR